jgi:arylsulfatase A-like enzyme
MRVWGPIGVVTVAALTATAGRGSPPRGRASVVVVMVDTLRSDHLSAYGYSRPTSPNLDAFARHGVRFANARSQAPCTFPSLNSLLTSRSPLEFLPWEDSQMGVPEGVPYLPAIAREFGYRTLAVTASPIFRRARPQEEYNTVTNFEHAFDRFEEDGLEGADAAAMNRRVDAVLTSTSERPLLLYIHYMDPHTPYHGSGRDSSFARPYAGPHEFIRDGTASALEKMLYHHGPPVRVGPADIQHLVDLYDDEIAGFDRGFAELVRILRRHELFDETLIVVTSDHGEEFMEHGHIHHCNCLYETTLRVPLVIRPPGGRAGLVRQQQVRSLDVTPTILDYLGIPPARYPLLGRSLRDVVERDAPRDEPSFAWIGNTVSDVRFPYKLVHDLRSGRTQLFDLRTDPHEKHDLGPESDRERARLLAEVRSWGGLDAPLEEDVKARLQALGYVE